jgi:uncharacterized membrane protein required for colicin V production
MIFDLVVGVFCFGALFNGYKNGLVTTILRTAFFIAGGVAAMYLVVKHNQSGAYIAAWFGTQLAKTLKFTLIRGPLRFIDSVLGAVLEVSKYVLLFYVVGIILLWAPWSAGQNSVSESKFFLQVNKHAPSVMTDIRHQIEKILANPRL